MTNGRPWTGAQEKWLLDAVSGGLDRAAVCEGLDRDPDTVRRKCHRLGIKMPRLAVRVERVYEQSEPAIFYATKELGNAINALMGRMDVQTLARCLGPMPTPKEPGSENVLRGQAAERRLAA